ncbi:MAG: type II toxin-antitoxin system CcdA family antitoxin [Minwuia sp.]|nr:type II toxin-antitoxin system CcdA family antitoxin [Minwuia sp.]
MAKIRTNLSLESDLVAEAKALKVNMSFAAETGVADAVRKAREEAWRRDNADAIRSYNEWVEKNGIPLSEFRQF